MLHHRPKLTQLPVRPAIAPAGQAEDDLRLERDVGQALGRTVMHLARDLAAELFLRPEQHARIGGVGRHGCGPHDQCSRKRAGRGASAHAAGHRPDGAQVGVQLDHPVAVAAEGPVLALQQLLLGLEQGRAPALGEQLAARVLELLGVGAWVALERGDPLLATCPALLMTF